MRIGIVGGGTAGLTTAHLLNDDHSVTLFEGSDRLGGHAHTITVERDGERIPIDAGFEFFSQRMYPRFCRLLHLLNMSLTSYPLTATFYRTDGRDVTLLPPLREGQLVPAGFTPRALANLLQLALVLRFTARVMQPPDTTTTLDAFVETLRVSRTFKERFLYPFLLAGWCVEPEEFRQFIAYNALRYVYLHQPSGLSPVQWLEIDGGMQRYIEALTRTLTRAQVRLASPVEAITREGDMLVVRAADRSTQPFDQIVIATNAPQASRLLTGLPETEDVRTLLGKVETFTTRMAIHGDERLMPPYWRHWSVVNARYDGRYSQYTIWKRWKSRKPVFKSWVTYETRVPEPLYAMATYEHAKVNSAYFSAQAALSAVQGRRGVWFAGAYVRDVDSHESAIESAMAIARALTPEGARLRQLDGAA